MPDYDDGDGAAFGKFTVDAPEKRRAEQQLDGGNATIIHPVTQLPTLTGFYDLFETHVKGSNDRWGLILFDIAAVTSMNDTLGYSATDVILRGVASQLKLSSIEYNSRVIHIKDDDFAVLTLCQSLKGLKQLAVKFMRDLERADIYAQNRDEIKEVTGGPVPQSMVITLNAGVTIWRKGDHIRKFLEEGMAACDLSKYSKSKYRVGAKTADPSALANRLSEVIRDKRLDTEVNVVRRYVELGCDLNFRQPHTHRTPLMWAMFVQHRELADYLASQPLDTLQTDESGNSYLMLSMKIKCFNHLTAYFMQKQVNVAQTNDEGETALYLAVKDNNVDAIMYLLAAKCPLDTPTSSGMTALKKAVHNNDVKVVKMLLEADANPNACGGSATPIQLAAYLGRNRCINLLLRNGADCEVQGDKVVQTPLQLAAFSGMSQPLPMLSPYNMVWEQPILAELGRERYQVFENCVKSLAPASNTPDSKAVLTLLRAGNTRAAAFLLDSFKSNGAGFEIDDDFATICSAPGARRLKRFLFYIERSQSSCMIIPLYFFMEFLGSLIFPFCMIPYFCMRSNDWRLKENVKFHMLVLCLLLCLGWLPGCAYTFLLGWYSPDFFTVVQQDSSSGTRGFLLSMFTLSFVVGLVLVWPWTFALNGSYFFCGALTVTGMLMPYFARRLKIMAIGLFISLLSFIPWALLLHEEEAKYVIPIFLLVGAFPVFYMLPVLLWASCFTKNDSNGVISNVGRRFSESWASPALRESKQDLNLSPLRISITNV